MARGGSTRARLGDKSRRQLRVDRARFSKALPRRPANRSCRICRLPLRATRRARFYSLCSIAQARRPDVPLHLGVTEAGLPPDGIIKTRLAFEKLLAQGIGDTIRVSLTLPYE